MSYTITRQFDGSVDEAREAIEASLGEEGFGILSEIDMGETLKEKVGEDVGEYEILGACNPPLAFDGVSAERQLGALLPCNVIVYEEAPGGQVSIAAVDPVTLLDVADNPELDDIATEVKERLVRALDDAAA
jgi:uncharacterized protein (DUF302 family)